MAEAKKRDLTTGPIWKALTVMSAPMSLGIFSVIAVGLADAYFLGQVSAAALAAVGFIYPVITAITSLSIGLSAGANATLSQSIGAGASEDETQRLGLHAIGLAVGLSVVLGLVIWIAFPAMFAALGASGEVAEEVAAYMPLWSASFPFLVTMMIVNSVFRAHGDGATSAGIMILAAFFGIALNPIFIFGWGPIPEMSTAGAAMSTLIGRVVAVVVALWIAWRRGLLGVCGNPLKGAVASARKILKVGIPASLSNAINPAGMALVTAAVATIGDDAVAGFGAAGRVQSILLVPLMALSSGIGPVVGQNWGAEKYDRARSATKGAFGFCLGYGAVVAVILFLLATPIAALLASGESDQEYAADYLRLVGLSMFGYGMVVVANAAMNARDKAVWSMSLSLGRIFAIYLPGAWIGVMLFGYWGILIAAILGNVLGGVAAAYATSRTGLLVLDRLTVTKEASKLSPSESRSSG
ncbi:MATE family efflux transporter [Sulfitobacter guttiformis]|uniref:Putative MATE family efflux protein n=1 Tax=Sulfitobacter guttiformis TaxID=74349 RepID=A0A420DPD2_9RHOB|nr:MATE family efflux transporter [Sulfitobacter guttiformis]KIN73474.1 putative MatE efflux family protein [Sulfitobacter guttiformis KCTC 32187]RKE96136.1 putative MATE family efflux protein [Sulfitobacter guttiformis]